MGDRLRFRIELADEVRCASLPTMVVSTLVENAVKHGLSTLPEGGEIVVEAHAEAGCLRVVVADDGAGLSGIGGAGVEVASAPHGQARVRGVADEVVAETQRAGVDDLGELATVGPGGRVERPGLVERAGEEVEVDGATEDGGLSHAEPGGRVEPVEPRRNEPLHRVGQFTRGAGCRDLGDELAQEERVAEIGRAHV